MASFEIDKKKSSLGKGLASLIPDAQGESPIPATKGQRDFFLCDIEKIVPNTYQPRKIFQKEALDELVDSVKVHGVLQPLIVRRKDGNYELIAGERRWRAAQKAGLKQVPVVVKDAIEDGKSLELAIIENVQRENLNCIEEALAFQQLIDEFNLSQEEVARRVGKNRVTVANTLRLLKLPPVIREDITSGKLSMGHARAMLSLETSEQQLAVRDLVLKKKLSVRDTERAVNDVLKAKKESASGPDAAQAHLKSLEEDLRRLFGSPVRVVGNEKNGFIQISYKSKEDLMRLADQLKGQNAAAPIGSV